MSSRIDLKFTQGDTIAESFTTTNEITEAAPSSNLSTVEILIKTNPDDADASALMRRISTDAAELVIDSAANWQFTMKATSAETAALAAGRWWIICSTIDAASNTEEAFRGRFTLVARGSDPSS